MCEKKYYAVIVDFEREGTPYISEIFSKCNVFHENAWELREPDFVDKTKFKKNIKTLYKTEVRCINSRNDWITLCDSMKKTIDSQDYQERKAKISALLSMNEITPEEYIARVVAETNGLRTVYVLLADDFVEKNRDLPILKKFGLYLVDTKSPRNSGNWINTKYAMFLPELSRIFSATSDYKLETILLALALIHWGEEGIDNLKYDELALELTDDILDSTFRYKLENPDDYELSYDEILRKLVASQDLFFQETEDPFMYDESEFGEYGNPEELLSIYPLREYDCKQEVQDIYTMLRLSPANVMKAPWEVCHRIMETIFGLKLKTQVQGEAHQDFSEEDKKIQLLNNIFEKKYSMTASTPTWIALFFFEAYEVICTQREKKVAAAKVAEREKILANLAHSIKNLISSVQSPLRSIADDTGLDAGKKRRVDHALKGLSLIKEIAFAIDHSYNGSIEDFRSDAVVGGEGAERLIDIIRESVVHAAENMFDRKYFEKPSFNYFPKGAKDVKSLGFEEFQRLSDSGDPDDLSDWLNRYLLDFSFEIDGTDDFAFKNTKNSAMKFRIMMQEIALNALKYSSYVSRGERFLRLVFKSAGDKVELIIENSMSPTNREKTTGNGRVVISQFAKLLGATPEVVKSGEKKTYKLKIAFDNFWQKTGHGYTTSKDLSLPMASDKTGKYKSKGE